MSLVEKLKKNWREGCFNSSRELHSFVQISRKLAELVMISFFSKRTVDYVIVLDDISRLATKKKIIYPKLLRSSIELKVSPHLN